MDKSRLEAFSDGVIAILITIMILELHAPEETTWQALRPMVPTFLAYVMSFVFVGIYWANHHHMLQLTERVNGAILWANMHLLFWLSLIPFVTAWMGEHHYAEVPTALYGIVLLCSGFAYTLLQAAIIRDQGPSSPLRAAVGRDKKGIASVMIYAIAIPLALYEPAIARWLYVAVVLMWLVPDPRIENHIREKHLGVE